SQQFQKKNKTLNKVLFAAAMVLVIFILYFSGIFNKSGQQKISGPDDQSIAVLPFINDSPDSSNVYIVNGLMESILNNLQKIGNLRVVSRTSVERFRNAGKTIPEIAKELNVKYLIEGSGQKMGDQIKLSIQLIEGHSDRHLWAQQYDRDTKDIFKLQSEIAAHIAGQIKVIVTPQEQNRINKPPTENLQAYDHYLKGRNFLNQGTTDGLKKSITWFRKSVEEDETFAIAYADLAIAYFYMDIFKQEKTFTDSLGYFADKAMFNDSHAVESLIAKALYHTNTGQYEQALPYLEKAHEYNPNSTFVINLLSEYYTNQLPDSEKYLEYALKGIRLDIGAQDSATTSITYLHLANAFIQLGFIAEAERYINKSLDFDTNNIYSHYVKAYIIYARNRNLKQTENLLLKTLARDTMRLDVLQEIGKVFFYQRNYPASFKYYKRFLSLKEELNWDIYSHENAKIGFVYHQMGLTGEADTLFRKYFDYAQNDRSIYQNLSLAVYYAYSGNSEEALKQLKLFAEINKYNYWTILFLDIDPLMDNLQNDPGFDEMIQLLNSNFYERHERIKHSLTVKGLI
ncbi:MAG: hypothetical protein KDC05_06535, partial [Bacteroidales bacterium]|nr:hypothetical protein [Bacteroidales bacterium]